MTDEDIMWEWAKTPNTHDMRIDLKVFARAIVAQARAELIAEIRQSLTDRSVAGALLIDDVLAIIPAKENHE